MSKLTIDGIDVVGKRVLVRVDFNVPLDADGGVLDDRRIRMAIPTLRSVLDRGGSLVLMSHLGRPAGTGFEPAYSLKPVADRLAELLPGVPVTLASEDCIGPNADRAVGGLEPGGIVLLENLRFHAAEKKNDPEFAAKLAAHGDVYVNDAFGTAHRAHASMVGVPEAMQDRHRVAGRLLEAELAFLAEAIDDAASPFVAVLGGAKVSDKLGAIRNLLPRVDAVVIGGGMAYTFLSVLGVSIGRSLFEEDMVVEARGVLEEAKSLGRTLLLPVDSMCAPSPDAPDSACPIEGDIPSDMMGLDIGPASATAAADLLRTAGTIVWNGPMGVFETPPFDDGSRAVADAVVEATRRGAISVIGGGETAAAIDAFGLAKAVSHVSTGGGASLQMLEGRSFRSVELLEDT
ncbi:MAG: phosphoglycerate kinase [Phycisphaerae bacterium]|nr:phosphoglycerate kinase [Phycisphaerae bacterium]